MALIPSPFNSKYISSPYGPRDIGFHSGTDWGAKAGAYPGAPIRASGPGLVMFSGWNGDRPGNVKTVLYDGFSLARRVVYCHLQNLNGARVNQRVNTGDIIGYVGNTGSAKGYHLHAELVGGGDPMKLIFDPNSYVGSGESSGEESETSKEWDEMATRAEIKEVVMEALASRPDAVLIHYGAGTRNGIVLAAPGFWHKFTGEQWTQFNAHGLRSGIREITPVNDRDYDVFKEIYSPAPVGISDAQIKAIADATANQVGVGDVVVDYDKIAVDVRNKFRAEPLK